MQEFELYLGHTDTCGTYFPTSWEYENDCGLTYIVHPAFCCMFVWYGHSEILKLCLNALKPTLSVCLATATRWLQKKICTLFLLFNFFLISCSLCPTYNWHSLPPSQRHLYTCTHMCALFVPHAALYCKTTGQILTKTFIEHIYWANRNLTYVCNWFAFLLLHYPMI